MSDFNPYTYRDSGDFKVEPVNSSGAFKKFEVSFSSACPTDYPQLDTVTGEYCLPNTDDKPPLVLLVHGVGDTSTVPCRLLAGALTKSGIASLTLTMPIHSRRLPAEMKRDFYSLSAQDWYNLYRISVVNIRQALDWAESRSELDSRHMGVAGISFGGYVSAIALGLDQRLRAGALLFTGGNLEKLARTRSSRKYARYAVSDELYRKNQSRYMAYVAEVAARGFENVSPPQLGYLFDPYTFTPELKTKPVLMMNALWDEYFPKEAVNDFWQASGKPRQVWLPAGHATAWVFYPVIRRQVVDMFRKTLLR
ncbi:MAG: alpha/beta hydrolase family protein [Dehalogenimonas sp.]|nr:alpha/beta hydrolase family protein [Dehalogenimonas sp.]